jgi:hypothetical protein
MLKRLALLLAGICTTVIMAAGSAAAATGPAYYSPEQAGYIATGARFSTVESTITLPDASKFAKEVAGFGVSVQLWTRYRVVVLGVSNSTISGDYSAAVAVYRRSTRSLICSTAGSGSHLCPHVPSGWTDGSLSFHPGDTVTLFTFHDPGSGYQLFQVDDETTGKSLLYHGYSPGAGKVYTQARVGAEFASSPWDRFAYTPPGAETRLVTFRDSLLQTYSGRVSSFFASWTRHQVVATSNGKSSGTVKVRPHNLWNKGQNFSVFLQP